MTVTELIAVLEKMPPDARVKIENTFGYYEIKGALEHEGAVWLGVKEDRP